MWADIRWKDIAKKFSNYFTPAFLRGVAYRLIKRYQVCYDEWLRDPLIDVVNYTLHQLKIMPKKIYRLKTLILESEGMIKPMKFNVKMNY